MPEIKAADTPPAEVPNPAEGAPADLYVRKEDMERLEKTLQKLASNVGNTFQKIDAMEQKWAAFTSVPPAPDGDDPPADDNTDVLITRREAEELTKKAREEAKEAAREAAKQEAQAAAQREASIREYQDFLRKHPDLSGEAEVIVQGVMTNWRHLAAFGQLKLEELSWDDLAQESRKRLSVLRAKTEEPKPPDTLPVGGAPAPTGAPPRGDEPPPYNPAQFSKEMVDGDIEARERRKELMRKNTLPML